MKKKLIGIFISMLFFTTILPLTSSVIADEPDPQITDDIGDAFGYIDIDSIWFFEQEETPEFLYVSMKIDEPSFTTFQQTFAVFWKHNNIRYCCSLHLGFSLDEWESYNAGKYQKRDQDMNNISGDYNFETGIITWSIPKERIGNPEKGDILDNTWSNAFRRLGFIGRIGFTRYVLDAIILRIFGNNMWDYAPERGNYGEQYIIRY